jgi:hypothetical protein
MGRSSSPLGTLTTDWSSAPATDDKWWWMWSRRWNEICQGKPKFSEKTSSLSSTNPTWPELGSNQSRRGGKPATTRLSYGTATSFKYISRFKRYLTELISVHFTERLKFLVQKQTHQPNFKVTLRTKSHLVYRKTHRCCLLYPVTLDWWLEEPMIEMLGP